MCSECWKEYGSPKIRNATVDSVVRSIKDVYDHSTVGGNLHCIVDDWNLEDSFFERYEVFNDDTTLSQLEDEFVCFGLLKKLSVKERASAMVLAHYGEFPE
jgi:hypothetical protein